MSATEPTDEPATLGEVIDNWLAEIRLKKAARDAEWDASPIKPLCAECAFAQRFDRTILLCRECWEVAGLHEQPLMPWEM